MDALCEAIFNIIIITIIIIIVIIIINNFIMIIDWCYIRCLLTLSFAPGERSVLLCIFSRHLQSNKLIKNESTCISSPLT